MVLGCRLFRFYTEPNGIECREKNQRKYRSRRGPADKRVRQRAPEHRKCKRNKCKYRSERGQNNRPRSLYRRFYDRMEIIELLTGHELTWMPEALRILRDELPNINVMISSQYSPPLADAISKGNVDAGFLRRERGVPELAFRPLVKEPIVVVLPSDHPLAARKTISPGDLVGETFVGVSRTAPVVRAVIDDYLKRSGINITPAHETEHVVMGVSLIASTGGVALLPAYAQNFLTRSVTSRPLKGDAPTVDLVLGYKKSNQSPVLKLLLSRLDELVARASNKTR